MINQMNCLNNLNLKTKGNLFVKTLSKTFSLDDFILLFINYSIYYQKYKQQFFYTVFADYLISNMKNKEQSRIINNNESLQSLQLAIKNVGVQKRLQKIIIQRNIGQARKLNQYEQYKEVKQQQVIKFQKSLYDIKLTFGTHQLWLHRMKIDFIQLVKYNWINTQLLCFSYVVINDYQLRILLSNYHQFNDLKVLYLMDAKLSNLQWKIIVEYLPLFPNIQGLNLQFNKISQITGQDLKIIFNIKKFKYLELYHNKLTNQNIQLIKQINKIYPHVKIVL